MNDTDLSYEEYLERVAEDREADLSKLLDERLGTKEFVLTVNQGNRGN